MKKISTVAAKQSKNFREQKLTIGLDLGDRSSWYCVLDEAGEVLLEQKLRTTPKSDFAFTVVRLPLANSRPYSGNC
jgi:transposase